MDNNQHKDLDKFFEGKLNNRQFDYQDDFWAEMETLLPEENSDNGNAGHSRRIIWGICLLLLITITGWLTYPFNRNSNQYSANAIPSESVEKGISTIEQKNALKPNSKSPTNLVNTENDHSNVSHTSNTLLKKAISKEVTGVNRSDNQTIINTHKNSIETMDKIINQSTIEKQTNDFNISLKRNLLSTPNKQKIENSDIINLQDKSLAIDNNSDFKTAKTNNFKLGKKETKHNFSKVDHSEISTLQNNFKYLTTLSFDKISNEPPTNISIVEPTCDGCPRLPNFRTLNLNLIAGLAVSQGWKNSQPNRAKPSLDPTIGVGLAYSPSPIADWTFGTELFYWSRSSLNAQYGYDSISYGFGVTSVSREIHIEELHNISLPIYVVYNKEINEKQHQFLGGININYILNAQSVTTGNGSFYNSNNVELFDISTTQEWGYTTAFNRFDVGLTFGYNYEIRDNWKLGARINYGLTDVAKDDIFNSNTFDNNLNIRLLLTYDLFESKF